MSKGKIYIAGPMRRFKHFNFPAFDEAKLKMEAQDWTVISPADIDRAHGFDPKNLPEDWDWSVIPDDDILKLEHIIPRDINALLECDGIYMLKGWLWSVGAFAEWAVALWAGKTVRYEEEPCIYTAWMAIGPKLKRRVK